MVHTRPMVLMLIFADRILGAHSARCCWRRALMCMDWHDELPRAMAAFSVAIAVYSLSKYDTFLHDAVHFGLWGHDSDGRVKHPDPDYGADHLRGRAMRPSR